MNRERYLDVVCGIMIVWVIMGHTIALCELKESPLYTIINHILPFFMPWFFFKAGMFYKQKSETQVITEGGGDY